MHNKTSGEIVIHSGILFIRSLLIVFHPPFVLGTKEGDADLIKKCSTQKSFSWLLFYCSSWQVRRVLKKLQLQKGQHVHRKPSFAALMTTGRKLESTKLKFVVPYAASA